METATPDGGYVLVVSTRKVDATTTLFFTHASRLAPHAIRLCQFGEPGLSRVLSAATAVIFVRGLFEFGGLPAFAIALGIPTYYFIDDNFIVLREQGGVNARYVTQYSADRVRDALRDFSGVLVASRPLMEYFSAHQLHQDLVLYPPVMGQAAHAADAPPGIRLAFFGGEHLRESFIRMVLPAIRRLAAQSPLTLVAMGLATEVAPSDGLTVVQHDYDVSYSRGIETLRRHHVNVFIHLVDGSQANSAYKNPHALISACALDAVPAVSRRTPYDDYCATHDVTCCSDSEAAWFAALSTLASDEALRATLRTRLREYCATRFDGAANRAVIEAILSRHRRPGAAMSMVRRLLTAGFLAAHLTQRVWRRAARRSAILTAGAA